jgi:hypothetical protein
MADERDTTTEQPADDLRAALESAYTEHEADEPSAKAEKPAGTGSDDRPRDEQGRFAPKSAETAQPEAAQPAQSDGRPPTAETAPSAPTGQISPTSREAPTNWQAADREAFAKMPAEAQDFLLRRHRDMEADYTRKTQATAELQREYGPVAQAFAPHREQLRAAGMTEGQLIQGWMQAEQALMAGGQSAVDLLARVVKSYRVDPAQLAAALGVSRETAAAHPGAGQQNGIELPPALRQQLEQLTGQVGQLTRAQQQAQNDRMTAELQRIDGEIAAFRAQPGHEHFADVEADMARLARAVQPGEPKPSLQQLYEQAVWANPSTREKLRAAERQSAEQKAREDARARATNARRAGSSVTGAPGPGQSSRTVKTEDRSLRDELEEAFNAHNA